MRRHKSNKGTRTIYIAGNELRGVMEDIALRGGEILGVEPLNTTGSTVVVTHSLPKHAIYETQRSAKNRLRS